MLPFQNFTAWVQQQAAAVQASATALLDLTVGSVLRAVLEANASVALWMQWLLLLVLQRTRLSTSTGLDVDSWVADFGMTREAATSATGSVTFSRATVGQAALIPVGAQVKTLDGTQTFAVTADITNAAYSAASNGYVVGANVASLTVPVTALTPGTGGNVLAAAIGLLATAVPGVDTVTNALAFTNALAAETDAALRARFLLFIAGLASATPAAIDGAAENVQQGVRLQNVPNSPMVGFYTLFVDDGSGDPPDSFINAITLAVQSATAEGITPVVRRFTPLSVSISVTLTVVATATRQTVVANVAAALAAYVAGLAITPTGMTLSYLQLPIVISAADPSAPGISPGSLTVNGGTSDINAAVGQLITASAISVA
jgi:hypothetical protein